MGNTLQFVTTGLGATTSITYQPLDRVSVYTRGTTGTYPTQDIQAAIYVASRVDASNGIGGTYSSSYSYAGGQSDLQGRGWLGFSAMTAKDLQTNVWALTKFNTAWPLTGLLGLH